MNRRLHLLALAGVFGIWLVGSASSALATCPTGKVGTPLNGNYAIKVIGAEIDNGIPTFDPQPAPIAGVGVFHASACAVTGGEFIYNDNGTFTGPVPGSPAVQGFIGSLSVGNLSGSYFFNSDNTGVLTLVDSSSGNTFEFGIAIEQGNQEFRGARINPGDPLSIVGEKQRSPVISAEFITPVSILCDGDGLSTFVFQGYDPISGTVQGNLDPDGTGAIEAGGNFFYNNDGGTIVGSPLGIQICDFTETFLGGSPYTADATENIDEVFNADFGCFLATAIPGFPLDDETSTVLWGSQNQHAFLITTGLVGSPYPGVATCTAGKAASAGGDSLSPSSATIVIPSTSTSVTNTLVLTNGSGKPLNLASISLSGLPDVSIITSGPNACPNPGSVPADNPLIGPPTNTFPAGTNTCNVVLTCSLATAGSESGTLTINADNLIGGTQTPSGATFNVGCTKD